MKTFCAAESADKKKNVRRKIAALSMIGVRLEVVVGLSSCFRLS